MMKPDVIALAKQHLLYAWAPALIAQAEAGDAKAKTELRKWLRLADVLPTPARLGEPSAEYIAERRAEQAAEDYIAGFCD